MPDVCVLTLGLIASFTGWIFNMITTGAPAWRAVRSIPGEPLDTVIHQGLWDICRELPGSNLVCLQEDASYFSSFVVRAARGLMITSVVLTGLAQVLIVLGVRCWRRSPNFLIAGLGGVVVFCGGIFSLVPVAWYTNQLYAIEASSTDLKVDYCVILGFIGACFQLLGGASLMTCFHEVSKRWNRVTTPRHNPAQRTGIRTVDARLHSP